MYKKTLTYEDFDGEEITEDFYFNLNKAEIIEHDDLIEAIARYGKRAEKKDEFGSKDMKTMMSYIKELMFLSYGEKSEDGRRFVKSEEILTDFINSNAFPDIYMEILTDETVATEFVEGVCSSVLKDVDPAELQKAIDAASES